MKLGVLITAFNEKHIIPMIEQYQGIADRIVVTVSRDPWCGEHTHDDTAERALTTGEIVIHKSWGSERDQRNDAMDIMRDMDYVIASHCDTWFTRNDLLKLKNKNLEKLHYNCNVYTYWKDYDTVIYPHLSLPTILVRSDAQFIHSLNIENEQVDPPILDITCHHVSWVKSDEEVLKKIQSYTHAGEIQPTWYTDVWKGWRPDMKDFGPTTPHDFHTTQKHALPDEIRNRL